MKNKGIGHPVTKQEITSYKALRRAGVSPQTAAETIGRSKSWAYNFEKANAEKLAAVAPIRRLPQDWRKDLGPAIGFCMAVGRGDDDLIRSMFTEHGGLLTVHVARLAVYLATMRAVDLQNEYGDQLLEGEVIQAEDVLETATMAIATYLQEGRLPKAVKLPPELDHPNYREWNEPGEAGSTIPPPNAHNNGAA